MNQQYFDFNERPNLGDDIKEILRLAAGGVGDWREETFLELVGNHCHGDDDSLQIFIAQEIESIATDGGFVGREEYLAEAIRRMKFAIETVQGVLNALKNAEKAGG